MDFTGNGEKVWWFQTVASQPYAGLQTDYEERQWSPHVAMRHVTNTWASDSSPSHSPYVATSVNTQYWNSGASWVQSKNTQTVDLYGNLLTQSAYDFGAMNGGPGGLLRTYTNTYLSTTAYTSLFIRNRLTSSTVTDGTKTVALGGTQYDEYALTDDPYATQHVHGGVGGGYGVCAVRVHSDGEAV